MECSTAALSGVGMQAIIIEFLIMYTDIIFVDAANVGKILIFLLFMHIWWF